MFETDGIKLNRMDSYEDVVPAGCVAWDGDEQYCAGLGNHLCLRIVFEEAALLQVQAKIVELGMPIQPPNSTQV